MKVVIEIEQKTGRNWPWQWFVLVDGRSKANGHENTERKARRNAEKAADQLPDLTPKYTYEYEVKS